MRLLHTYNAKKCKWQTHDIAIFTKAFDTFLIEEKQFKDLAICVIADNFESVYVTIALNLTTLWPLFYKTELNK